MKTTVGARRQRRSDALENFIRTQAEVRAIARHVVASPQFQPVVFRTTTALLVAFALVQLARVLTA